MMMCGNTDSCAIRPRALGLDTWRVRIDCEQAGVGPSGGGVPQEAVLRGDGPRSEWVSAGTRAVTIMSTGKGPP
jgi:hypothetical protein